MVLERLHTGIPGLDTLLDGGLIPGRTYVVAGPPGSGKTTLSMQFLVQARKERKNALYVTIDEPPNEIRMNMAWLGKSVNSIRVLDSIPDIKSYDITMVKDVSSVRKVDALGSVSDIIRKTPEFKPLEASIPSLQQTLKQEMQRARYDRIVLDSLTALLYYSIRGEDERAAVQSFMRFLMDMRTTILLTVEETSRLTPYEPYVFLSRGAIRLWRWWSKGELMRAISVEKFKGSSFDEIPRKMEFTGKGLVVHPEVRANPPISRASPADEGSDPLGSARRYEDDTKEDLPEGVRMKKMTTLNPYLKRDMG